MSKVEASYTGCAARGCRDVSGWLNELRRRTVHVLAVDLSLQAVERLVGVPLGMHQLGH